VERYDWTAAAAELEEALNAAARRNDGATQTGALQAIA